MTGQPLTPQQCRWVVLYRDNFICQMCGAKAKFSTYPWFDANPKGAYCDLIVHHIFGRLHWEWQELITVCSDCHIDVCHKGGYKVKNPLPFDFKPRQITEELITQAVEEKRSRIDSLASRW